MHNVDSWKIQMCDGKIENTCCQVFDSYVHSSNYALLVIAELPNNELTSIHTLSLPPLLL